MNVFMIERAYISQLASTTLNISLYHFTQILSTI